MTMSGQVPASCWPGPLRCCPRRSAADPGCGPTLATSTPRSRTRPSRQGVTSRSQRSATRLPGGHFRPSRTPIGATPGAWPTGWPEGTYTIIRRVKIGVEQLSADPRSRRRRTVAKDQLALALGGAVDHVWAVSFIVTNIPASHGDYVGLEAWFRNRTSIEERFR